eukprot:1309203-Pyramimonas_sp.AAC.1
MCVSRNSPLKGAGANTLSRNCPAKDWRLNAPRTSTPGKRCCNFEKRLRGLKSGRLGVSRNPPLGGEGGRS